MLLSCFYLVCVFGVTFVPFFLFRLPRDVWVEHTGEIFLVHRLLFSLETKESVMQYCTVVGFVPSKSRLALNPKNFLLVLANLDGMTENWASDQVQRFFSDLQSWFRNFNLPRNSKRVLRYKNTKHKTQKQTNTKRTTLNTKHKQEHETYLRFLFVFHA